MSSHHIKVVTEANFENEVLKSDKLVLIDFWAEWCGPCKALAPTLEAFAEANKEKVKVVKINVDDNPRLAAAFQIQGIPTLVTMKDGQGIYGTMGNLPASALEDFVSKSAAYKPPGKTPPDIGGPNLK